MIRLLFACTVSLGIGAVLVTACSWDNPVWPKSPLSDTPLFRFVAGGGGRERTGYIDANGHVVIHASFGYPGDYGGDDFFDGIALIWINEQPWYIGPTGKKLFRRRDSGIFTEGLAPFRENGKWGYLDTRGEVVISAEFDGADQFSEGIAAVQVGEKFGYIDKKGKIAIKPSFAKAFPFENGAARVIRQSGCLYIGYGPCDAFNPVVLPDVPARWQHPTMNEARCMYSFIDRTGKELFGTAYREAKDFSEELAPVGDGWRWGFVDPSGRMAIPLVFDNAEPFSEGLAAVQMRDKHGHELWGYVDHSGKLVIEPAFLSASPFSEELAVVMNIAGEYEFIDKTGERAISDSFVAASSFVMGRAHVRYKHDYDTAIWAYIDHHGHAVFRYNEHGVLTP